MRQIVHLIIIYAALLTLAGCGDGKSVRQLPHLGDTPYQQDTILVTYATNPERAKTLLDSALLLGNISEYRAQCIRARIYSKSLVEQRQDSAILICKDIFQLSRRRVGAAFAQGSEFASLSDFIRDCRLEYSCNLLVTRPDLSIKEVAAKSGFNYASNYSSDFKNRYTMTPSNYRELKAKK